MAVNEFFEYEPGDYSCCRFYTTIVANTEEEYRALTDEEIDVKAHNAWCTGAR